MTDPVLDAIMEASWAGCIRWAAGEPEVVARFERETGKKFPRARSGIERLVDDATGHNPFSDFVEWVTREVFGIEDAPKAYREHLAATAARQSHGRPGRAPRSSGRPADAPQRTSAPTRRRR